MTDYELTLIEYRDLKRALADDVTRLKKLENDIKIAARAGETGDVEGVTISVIEPKKPRVKWDSAGLEGLALVHKEILELRSEYWASPSVRIKVD